jgi:hypothetical protein
MMSARVGWLITVETRVALKEVLASQESADCDQETRPYRCVRLVCPVKNDIPEGARALAISYLDTVQRDHDT